MQRGTDNELWEFTREENYFNLKVSKTHSWKR